MTAPDLDPGSSHGHRDPMESGGGAWAHWLMMACCVPMAIIVAVLVAPGTVSAGWVLRAAGCVLMMWFMMRPWTGWVAAGTAEAKSARPSHAKGERK